MSAIQSAEFGWQAILYYLETNPAMVLRHLGARGFYTEAAEVCFFSLCPRFRCRGSLFLLICVGTATPIHPRPA